jgi:hypothetical protein
LPPPVAVIDPKTELLPEVLEPPPEPTVTVIDEPEVIPAYPASNPPAPPPPPPIAPP